ncbi:SDR family NAD(P)-dependent oxidoreductase [Hymenobacter elongatus]|uniref:SDR family NAD(P)-dependent oxidoreductase n=1 Tax=Hymenobacter elongatus TaxID=877208 RepID=A0A4Z0PQ77_9BACT|nr:SDR family NAD(P)-dependent oxidoreductase [Hymenobacter elongatus]TGE19253.1 SDR family NAD(P)-dependent oxidoreductase [Hymenobacter elongatus]
MQYYIITGTSRGLGKALAEAILRQPDTTVIGVSRHASLENERYRHTHLDFSDSVAVENNVHSVFPRLPDAAGITLINNAAVLGEIGYCGEQINADYSFVFSVNVVVPAVLMDAFLRVYSEMPVPRTILNISSGAAQRPVDGWAAYCASKAALEALTATVHKEQALRGSGVRVHCLSPGVVDTAMQEQIRTAEVGVFSEAARFGELYEQRQLPSPEQVADKIVRWLQSNTRQQTPVGVRLADL